MSRWIHLLFSTLILLTLLVLFPVYLYKEGIYFKREFIHKVDESLPLLKPPFESIHGFFKSYGVSIQLALGVLFLIFTIYILSLLLWYSWKYREKRQGKLNKKVLLALWFLCCLAGIGLGGIYYWPKDQVDCYFFVIDRGSSAQFLAKILDIGVMVTGFHLFLFLLLMMAQCLLPGKKKRERN